MSKIWEKMKKNKKKIWNIIRITYWTFLFVVALLSIVLLYTEFLSA
ncbi:MAG: hypothetical protein ACTSRH_07920 [Promethearchaeota archaeon]